MELENKTYYIIYCVSQFAQRFGLSLKQSYAYLKRYSLDDAVDDLAVICHRYGGGLVC